MLLFVSNSMALTDNDISLINEKYHLWFLGASVWGLITSLLHLVGQQSRVHTRENIKKFCYVFICEFNNAYKLGKNIIVALIVETTMST